MTLRPAVLIPTYNNAATVAAVAEKCLQFHGDVLVVNDGSTDGTVQALAPLDGRITIHTHPRNLGKGKALRNGFELLLARGFSHAISVDADGQHYPEDLPLFLQAIERGPGALIVGRRDLLAAGAPLRSRFGLWCSNALLRTMTGARLLDSQCGFRAYPLEAVAGLKLAGERYDLELEVLVLAGRRGLPLVQVPVQVTYAPAGGRVTHFRPLRDFLQIARRVSRL